MGKKLMTRNEIREMWNGLQTITTDEVPRKFAYAIARNRSKLRKIVEDIIETTKPLDEFEEKRIALAKKMAKKDPDGEPIMLPNNQGYFVPDLGKFNRELEKVKEETGQDKRDTEVETLLKSKEEIELYVIPFEMMPETFRSDIMEALLPMLDTPLEGTVTPLRDVGASDK